MEKCVDEIGAEQSGYDQADDGLRHGPPPLEMSAGADIGAGEKKKKVAEKDIGKVEHLSLLTDDAESYGRAVRALRGSRCSQQ
jgi:hypothetical protein